MGVDRYTISDYALSRVYFNLSYRNNGFLACGNFSRLLDLPLTFFLRDSYNVSGSFAGRLGLAIVLSPSPCRVILLPDA